MGAQESLQSCAVFVSGRADFLQYNFLHNFALHGILAPLFRRDAPSYNVMPLAMNLVCQSVVLANPELQDGAAHQQKHYQHYGSAQHGQNPHSQQKFTVGIAQRVENGVHPSLRFDFIRWVDATRLKIDSVI